MPPAHRRPSLPAADSLFPGRSASLSHISLIALQILQGFHLQQNTAFGNLFITHVSHRLISWSLCSRKMTTRAEEGSLDIYAFLQQHSNIHRLALELL